MNLQAQLRKAIAESGLPLSAIAEAAGVGYATVHGFANGDRGISFENVNKLAKVLGLKFQQNTEE